MFVVKNVSLFLAFFCLFSLNWMVNGQTGPFPKRAKFSGLDLDPQFCGIRAREQYEWLQIVKCGSLSGVSRSQCIAAVAPIYGQLQNACQTYNYQYNMYVSRQTPINILAVDDGYDLPRSPMPAGSYDDFGRVPIDYENANPGPFFKINYLNQNIEGYQSGYKFKVHKWVGPYTVEYNGATYELAGWHFHKPAEHTFDDVNYQMEIHFVHVMTSAPYLGLQRDQDKYLVLGFQMEDFSANTFNDNANCAGYGPFDGLLTQPVSSTTVQITTDMVSRIFTYEGGLTTPPFTARVRWMLGAYPIQTSQSLMDLWGPGPINPDYKDIVWINEPDNVPWLTGNKVLQWKQFGHYPLSTRTAFPDRPPVRELYADVLLAYTSTSVPDTQYMRFGCPTD
jgi:carbonic anhydrase